MKSNLPKSIEPNLKSQRNLCVIGSLLVLIFMLIFAISAPFEYGSELPRPILVMTGLLMVATFLAFLGLKFALKIENQSRNLVLMIIGCGISLRLIGLFTCPILEIDYYRYIWDGKVANSGVSPYRYSPKQILESDPRDNPSLQKIVSLSASSQSNHAILDRIHFSDYTTIYPPVSQFVFAATMKFFPASASIQAHIVAIKSVLILFDLLTLGLIYLLLRQLKFHIGWLIAYAWNPLVIKEISNGGHLDSIATFLLVASVFLLVQWSRSTGFRSSLSWAASAGVTLGLGVGAKIFPIVLFPAMFVTIARRQWMDALMFAAMFLVSTIFFMWPMYRSNSNRNIAVTALDNAQQQKTVDTVQANDDDARSIVHPSQNKPSENKGTTNKEGLSGFLSGWRMNDVVFSAVYLNLKSTPETKASNSPWFVLTSNRFRTDVTEFCKSNSIGSSNPSFLLARIVTLSLFAIFYLWQLVGIFRSPSGIPFDRFTMIMVVFLFLQPTVNPWYWIWIVPLACLARKSVCIPVSGLLLVYYSRFWFTSLSQTFELSGTTYTGTGLFDHGIAWVEFFAIVIVLLASRSPSPGEETNTREATNGVRT